MPHKCPASLRQGLGLCRSGKGAERTAVAEPPFDNRVALNVLMTIMTIKMPEAADVWTLAEAKAKLSELIEHAQKHGPQTITRKGRKVAVVVDAEEWTRRTRRAGTLADFFAASPLTGSGLNMRRSKDRLRTPEL